jgi:hypothetical protein
LSCIVNLDTPFFNSAFGQALSKQGRLVKHKQVTHVNSCKPV